MEIGKLKIEDGDIQYEVDITKKDIKILKNLMAKIEQEIYISTMGRNVREKQENDQRLITLYKLLGY